MEDVLIEENTSTNPRMYGGFRCIPLEIRGWDHKFLVFLFLMGWLMIIYANNACLSILIVHQDTIIKCWLMTHVYQSVNITYISQFWYGWLLIIDSTPIFLMMIILLYHLMYMILRCLCYHQYIMITTWVHQLIW